MPCGQICKEIVDNQAAVVRQMSCMTHSILLSAVNDGPSPTPEMAAEFQQRAEALARCAAAIEVHVNTPVSHTPPPAVSGTNNPQGGAA